MVFLDLTQQNMSYEINILVVNQEFPVRVPFESSIILQNEVDNADCFVRYHSVWPFLSSVKGILYTLVQEWFEDYYSSFPLCDSEFENQIDGNEMPTWIEEEARQNMTALLIKESVVEDFKRIVRHLLYTSPNGLIVFHSRYEGGDREIIFGTMSIELFFELLEQKKIYFNTGYIIDRRL